MGGKLCMPSRKLGHGERSRDDTSTKTGSPASTDLRDKRKQYIMKRKNGFDKADKKIVRSSSTEFQCDGRDDSPDAKGSVNSA
ncbi:hypothetical protein BsWGS_26356 [Bradybaena similaris]